MNAERYMTQVTIAKTSEHRRRTTVEISNFNAKEHSDHHAQQHGKAVSGELGNYPLTFESITNKLTACRIIPWRSQVVALGF